MYDIIIATHYHLFICLPSDNKVTQCYGVLILVLMKLNICTIISNLTLKQIAPLGSTSTDEFDPIWRDCKHSCNFSCQELCPFKLCFSEIPAVMRNIACTSRKDAWGIQKMCLGVGVEWVWRNCLWVSSPRTKRQTSKHALLWSQLLCLVFLTLA